MGIVYNSSRHINNQKCIFAITQHRESAWIRPRKKVKNVKKLSNLNHQYLKSLVLKLRKEKRFWAMYFAAMDNPNFLDIGSSIDIDEIIAHYEIHYHLPHTTSTYGNCDGIHIAIQYQDQCLLPSHSSLHIRGKVS